MSPGIGFVIEPILLFLVLDHVKITDQRQVVRVADVGDFKMAHLDAFLVQDEIEFLPR